MRAGSRAALAWSFQKNSWFGLDMPSPALPSLVLLTPPQHPWLRALLPWQTDPSLHRKLRGKFQELTLGDGTDCMIMA